MSLVLKELEIIKHPLLKTEGKLTFSDGINLLVGKNGSGKTRLLELINSCLSFNFSRYNDNPLLLNYSLFDEEGELILDVSYSHSLNSDKKGKEIDQLATVYIPSDIQNSAINCTIRLSNMKEEIFRAEVNDSRLHFMGFKTTFNLNLVNIDSHNVFYKMIMMSYSKLHNHPQKDLVFLQDLFIFCTEKREFFYEENKYFDIFFGESIALALPDDWDGSEELWPRSSNKLFSKELFNLIKHFNNSESIKSLAIELNAQNNKALHEASVLLNYNDLYIKLLEPEKKTTDDTEVIYSWDLKQHSFKVVVDDETIIDYKELSYGEKRYILLMLYLASNQIACMDEPIDGLHHSMIKGLILKLSDGKRQSFIANQSPVLFDYIEFDSESSAIDQIVVCKKDKDKKLLFSNPSKLVASAFYQDYEDEFLQVSEILKNHELW